MQHKRGLSRMQDDSAPEKNETINDYCSRNKASGEAAHSLDGKMQGMCGDRAQPRGEQEEHPHGFRHVERGLCHTSSIHQNMWAQL